jgi:hypothetical protein
MTTQPHSTSPGTDPVSELRAIFDGRVIAPEDAAYDAARAVFYGSRNRRPAAVVRAKDAADVSRVVTLAREKGLELAVKSGGHSLAGHSASEGGIVLDLSQMKGLEIDVEARTAWAETGLTAGEYTAAVGAHGLATGFGDTGSVGIGGITLGGGAGFLVRKHGLTIDNLLAAEIVTADGELLHVDAETHPELFWAIRGGGGNFGVATRFKFRLHKVDEIVGGMLIIPAHPRYHRLLRRGSRGRARRAFGYRQHHGRPADAVFPGRGARQARHHSSHGVLWRRRGRRARRRAFPLARRADPRHGETDALPGDVRAG